MNTFWQLGRIGSMIVRLNYTWLIVGGLAVWYLAQVWLPPYLSGAAVWPLAGGIVILYGGGLLFAEGVRTGVAGIFSPAWPRSVHLFPFGAAAAYPLRTLGTIRAAGAALVGPVILALLGGIYGGAAFFLPGPALLVAILQTLAASHLAVAALSLIPGLPLAGGWFLIAVCTWVRNDRKGGLTLARRLGLLISLALAGVGVVWMLQNTQWAPGLTLLALAWAIREGGVEVERRARTRLVLETLTAAELMQPPARVVAPGSSLAAVLWEADQVAPDAVLGVRATDGRFAGLLPVARTDDILPGTWATTPVQTVMIPASAFTVVRPEARLADVLVAFARQLPSATDRGDSAGQHDPGYVPVVKHGRLIGLISRAQVSVYEDLGTKVGVQEAAALAGLVAPRRSRRTWVPLLAGGVVAALALLLLPNPASGPLRADPAPAAPDGAITFGEHTPETDAVVGRGTLPIRLTIASSAPVLTVTIQLQGEPLAVTLAPAADGTQVIASATASAFLLGRNQLQVEVQAEGGQTARTAWGFRVGPGLTPEDPRPPAAPPAPRLRRAP